MKFFKHFADAHEGRSMQALMNKFGLEGYAAFFILTEICASKLEKEPDQKFTEDHLKFTFNERIVREKLRMRSTKVELFLNYCSTLDLLQFTKDQDEIIFYFPKLLESMDRDTKRARQVRGIGAPKIKNKEEDKEEDKDKEEDISTEARNLVPFKPKEPAVLIKISDGNHVEVSQGLIMSWADTFPKDFLDLEVKKARSWLIANSHKAPKKNFGRFFNNWFNRSWDDYRKNIKSNPSSITVDALNDLLGAT